MRRRFPWRTLALLVCVVAVVGIAVSAQSPSISKRPLTYDVVDYWKSIQGTRLSNDGKWLAYTVTSQAEDGELIVRNLATGQEFRHPRGTGPTFTEDGKFLIFSIAQTKAEEEKDRVATEAAAATGAAGEQTAGAGRTAGGGQAAVAAAGAQAAALASGQTAAAAAAAGNQAAAVAGGQAAATGQTTGGGGQATGGGQTGGRAGRGGRAWG